MNRFYISPERWNPDALILDAAESHHCLHVLRLKAGARVTAFNGAGMECHALISGTDPQAVELSAIQCVKTPKLPAAITLGQAIPKGKNMELIIQKATELGAAAIAPLISERTIVRLGPDEAATRAEKWRHTVIEAAKQCGQNWIPQVTEPQSPKDFFQQNQDFDLMLIGSLQNDARPLREVIDIHAAEHNGALPRKVLVLVGPEGDFTPAELGLAKSNGAVPITLGPIVLRTETASLFCLSVLAYELQR